MEANLLTISVPPLENGPVCDKNCQYCISVLTGGTDPNPAKFYLNMNKALTLARAANASTVLLTGKGEPMLNIDAVCMVLDKFREFPLELQTNGIVLRKDPERLIMGLVKYGLDTVALSIDNFQDVYDSGNLIDVIRRHNITCRICFNLTNKVPKGTTFVDIFQAVKQVKAHQLLIRNVMIPKVIENSKRAHKVVLWITENVDPLHYKKLYIEFESLVDRGKDLVRVLPHGVEVYDLEGIGVSFSDYCIQEHNNTRDIRSLIYLDDGHMTTSWDKPIAGRLF